MKLKGFPAPKHARRRPKTAARQAGAMLWRIRTTLADRPGDPGGDRAGLRALDVNILGMQVFPTSPRVTDEFIVSAPDGLGDVQLAELFEEAGGSHVSATRVSDDSLIDAPTRYLRGVHQVLEDGPRRRGGAARAARDRAPGRRRLPRARRPGPDPPQRLDVLRISRAIPFTAVERARAQALLSLVSDAGYDTPLISPSARHQVPMVREATLADIEAVSALHERCSVETLYNRYQVPLRMPMTTRMARRLVGARGRRGARRTGRARRGRARPAGGWSTRCGRSSSSSRTRGRARASARCWSSRRRPGQVPRRRPADVHHGGVQRQAAATVGNAGFVARVERHDGNVHITVPLSAVRATAAG